MFADYENGPPSPLSVILALISPVAIWHESADGGSQ